MPGMIRAIIEVPQEAIDHKRLIGLGSDDTSDVIVDVLIEAFDTPMVGVLDLVEEGEPAWYRSSGF